MLRQMREKSDLAKTIQPDSGCMLAVMAITVSNQNASPMGSSMLTGNRVLLDAKACRASSLRDGPSAEFMCFAVTDMSADIAAHSSSLCFCPTVNCQVLIISLFVFKLLLCGINRQELSALDSCHTGTTGHKHKLELPEAMSPGISVNTKYINSAQ